MKEIFKIAGMTCSSCEEKISGQVSKLPGVLRVQASSSKGEIEIESSKAVSTEELQQALSKAGSYTIVLSAESPYNLRNFGPLIAVISYIVGATVLLVISSPDPSLHFAMSAFMGSFFVLFSLFKMLDLNGFAEGFSTYDIVAKRSRVYALTYPFIELGLGIMYLLQLAPTATNLVTLVVMVTSFIGVFKARRSGSPFQCACLGTVLKVPLSTVTLIENGVMAGMAAIGL